MFQGSAIVGRHSYPSLSSPVRSELLQLWAVLAWPGFWGPKLLGTGFQLAGKHMVSVLSSSQLCFLLCKKNSFYEGLKVIIDF